MISARSIFNHFRRVVVSVLLMGLLLSAIAPAAQADYAPGAPDSPNEKQKTLYEGNRNVVNSPGEPAKANLSTNANTSSASSRTSETVKNNPQDRAETAIDKLVNKVEDTFDSFKKQG